MSYISLTGHVVEVDPLTVNALYYSLGAKNHTVRIVLGKGVENALDFLTSELFRSLCTDA